MVVPSFQRINSKLPKILPGFAFLQTINLALFNTLTAHQNFTNTQAKML